MHPKFYLLLFVLFAFATTPFAQTGPGLWMTIEQNVQHKLNLSFVSDQLDALQQTEAIRNNPASLARLYHYHILIGDAKSEDTSFFKQSHSLDSILQYSSNAPLKAIVHLMLAKRLILFETKFSYRNNKILFRNPGGPAYSEMPQPVLDSTISFYFDAAKKEQAAVASIPISELLWLSSDPYLFLFQPGFADVAIGEKLQWLQHPDNKFSASPATRKTELLLSPDAFLHFIDTVETLPKTNEKVLRQYKAWADNHGPKDPMAYYFIETLARKYFYQSLHVDSSVDRQYEGYLTRLLASGLTTVKAHAVYQLCLLWNKQAGKYNPNNSTDYYWNGYGRRPFDSTYRLHYAKALNLYQSNQHLLDSFPFMEKILATMEEKILQPQLKLTAADEQLPGKPVALSLAFRNSPVLYVRLVQLPAAVAERAPSLIPKEQLFPYFNYPIVRDTVYHLPNEKDYQPHQCFLATGPLPPGHYLILYSNEAINESNKSLASVQITTTAIAVINNDRKVFVLNRQTGFPVAGASLTVEYEKTKYDSGKRRTDTFFSKPKPVGKEGFAEVPEKAVQRLWAIYGKDTLIVAMNALSSNTPADVYDKDIYDGLADYYEDQVRLHLFTDRSIYRPGQTVFFKGIFIIRNPRTGEPLVLNWKNLKLPFFQKLLLRLIVRFGKKKIPLYIEDAFGRNIDTLQVLPNKFGSVAGSFTIPKNAATGDWNMDADDIDLDYNNDGKFKVEEYKRPSFEVSIIKPKKDLQLGDSFHVTVQVRSFAGASLSGIPIHYTVERSGYTPKPVGNGKEETWKSEDLYTGNEDDEEEEGIGYTNEKGELIIPVNDTLLKQYVFDPEKKWDATYEIEAEAIDPTGESHDADSKLVLSTRPYRIENPIPATLDRSDLKPVFIRVNSSFAGPVQKQATVRIYKTAGASSTAGHNWPITDTWLYDKTTFIRWFPEVAMPSAYTEQDSLVYTGSLTAGGEQPFILLKALLVAGHYRMVANTVEGKRITGESTRLFSVFDPAENRLPDSTAAFEYLAYNQVAKGQPIRWVTGNSVQDIYSIYHVSYFAKGKKGLRIRNVYDLRPEGKGINEWVFPVPEDADKEVLITHLYIFNNHLYHQSKTIYLPADGKEQPQIVVEQYRHQLTPGSANTFSVSIKTKNENIAAELMSTLYDASLDKIEKHEWVVPGFYSGGRVGSQWDRSISSLSSSWLFNYTLPVYNPASADSKNAPLWWLNPLDYFEAISSSRTDEMLKANLSTTELLQGKLAGLSVASANGLNEVVVIGYGGAPRRDLTGSVSNLIVIQGAATFTGYSKALFVVDGVMYEGDVSKIDASKLTDAVVLTDAAAVALYGSRGANGVILISTKGPVIIPELNAEPPVVIRKNFAETAFFLPQVHADRHGYYTLSFTLPESVTEWKWKLLAHTKDARFAYLEKSIVSQLPLMIQPNMPRYLHQGDKLLLHSRITNLDTAAATGTATLFVEDAVTGADITALLTSQSVFPFSLSTKSNTTASFTVQIPANFLHPLKIKITARTAGYADGEVHTLPVMSRQTLVSQSQPVILYGRKDTILHPPVLPDDTAPFGIGLSVTPKPQSALLSSLAYLTHYPYGCAEQTFNKLLAHAVGLQLMQTDTALQHSFARLPQPKEKRAALPDELAEATMPWLQLNHAHQLQQQQLRTLLDTFAGKSKIQQYFKQLTALQNADGGITWFTGGRSDLYISTYILAGFGKAGKEGLSLQTESGSAAFITKLMQYCDAQFSRRQIPVPTSTDTIQYLYARSFWLRQYAPVDSIRQHLQILLGSTLKNINDRNLYQQALLMSTALRFEPPFSALAKQQLENIRQLSISDTVNGTRWKTISNSDDLNISSEETVAAIAEAFGENDSNPTMVKGILQWLMQNREAHQWGSTKAAAAVVSLLRQYMDKWNSTPAWLGTTIEDDQALLATNDLLLGQLTHFMETAAFAPSLRVSNLNPSTPASGGLNYYYFTAYPPQENSSNVKIKKEYFVWNKPSADWQPIASTTILKTADKIKTVITLTTFRPLQYVLIDDKSAAALEPADATSGYEYTSGIPYYKSVRDAGFQFFAEQVPSGISTISYETVVAQQGSFATGTTSLQCMYRPEVRSYAQGIGLVVQ